jgi:GR25 family glycosyltransferase involved in LPS biosynthesis
MVPAQMSGISLAVVGHPDRQEMLDQLVKSVRADAVSLDNTAMGCGRNHLKAIAQAYGHAVEHYKKWIVILEDDAIPVPDFRAQVEAALQHAPTQMVSFYLGINHPLQYQYNFSKAVKEQTSWIIHPNMRHAVGYAIGIKYVPSLRETMSEFVEKNWAPDDAMSEYAKATKHLVSYTNPSLVDHQDSPSVIKNRTHLGEPVTAKPLARKAHRFGPKLNWDGTYTTVEVP